MCDVGGRRLSEIRVVVLINAAEPSGGPFSQNSQIIRPKLLNFSHNSFEKKKI
jgi:hypothetical protein